MDIKKDIVQIINSGVKDYPNMTKILIWEKKDMTKYSIIVLYNENTYQYAIDIKQLLIPQVISSKHSDILSVVLDHEDNTSNWVTFY